MPFRPSGYIGWASTGATNVTEPTDAKKAVGWSTSEKPASAYFNWLLQKQDQWIQYFRWADTLRTVVQDDFVYTSGRGFSGIPNFGPTMFLNSPGNGWSIDDTVAVDANSMGIARLGIVGSNPAGTHDLLAPVGNPGDRDLRMEFIAKMVGRGQSGTSTELGLIGFLSFLFTGASGYYGLNITPTGRTTTGIPLNIDPITTTYKKLEVERQGATMLIRVDDALVATVPGVMIGASGAMMSFGCRHIENGSLSNNEIRIDRVDLKVARSPV